MQWLWLRISIQGSHGKAHQDVCTLTEYHLEDPDRWSLNTLSPLSNFQAALEGKKTQDLSNTKKALSKQDRPVIQENERNNPTLGSSYCCSKKIAITKVTDKLQDAPKTNAARFFSQPASQGSGQLQTTVSTKTAKHTWFPTLKGCYLLYIYHDVASAVL